MRSVNFSNRLNITSRLIHPRLIRSAQYAYGHAVLWVFRLAIAKRLRLTERDAGFPSGTR